MQRGRDLPRDRSARSPLVERVPPQVAEDAAKRAFAIRQEDRRDVEHSPVRLPFRLDERGDRLLNVDRRLRPARQARRDP